MQIPILNGVYTNESSDFRVSYPVNMVPVPIDQGISKGYLRPADGCVSMGTGPGVSRGGINWKGVCYRVMGTKLVSISSSGVVTTLGDVGGSGPVSMDYSFDRLAVSSGGNLFYWNGSTLQQVTDPDLGTVVDFIWVAGYFMTTDGDSLIVTELNDPMSVNPLKYGSSESDPDPIKALIKLRNEVYAINRYTIEVFDNVGGDFFPFQRIEGAQIQKGSVGTNSVCLVSDSIAFVGGGRGESLAVYLSSNSSVVKVSTREIDLVLAKLSDSEASGIALETRIGGGYNHIYIRLPDRTLVYDVNATALIGEPVWFILTSSGVNFASYRPIHFVWCYGKWLVGDSWSNSHGQMSDAVSSHFGSFIRWEFSTAIMYNQSMGAIFHSLELVALTGRVDSGQTPQISTSHSSDGVTWSQEKSINVGVSGDRTKRIVWLRNGHMRRWRIQRFKGDSRSLLSIARLEAVIEPTQV